MKNIRYLLLVVSMLVLVSCGTDTKNIGDSTDETSLKIHRFENIIFQTPLKNLQETLIEKQYDYRFLFNTNVESTQYFEEIKAFASDSTMQQVYQVVQKTYPSVSWLEVMLDKAMTEAERILPYSKPANFYTLMTGTFAYYDRVICTDSFMAINIDQYSIKNMKYFNGYFGLPMYIVNLLDSIYLPVDCMAAYAISKIPQGNNQQSMLDYMIFNGKVLYFLDKVFPKMDDCIKIRYSADQMKWAEENEGNIWGYFIQKQLLYENDYNKIRPFVNEAPSTSVFENSAPRLTDFIGWKIVKRYMDKKGVSMKELFNNTNSQQILTDSGYKPKRTK